MTRKLAAAPDIPVEVRLVHPVAELFPMLMGDDLQALADDIADRGLLHPIVLDTEGRILDGRNRLVACEIAGVAPDFETYTGDDPDGYALATNIARRSLTKGQAAMIAARADVRFKLKRPKREQAALAGVRVGDIGRAATIIEFAPDMVSGVVSGAIAVDRAYAQARDRKRAKVNTDDEMDELKRDHPGLAESVTAGDVTLDEAIKLGRQRVKSQRQAELDWANRFARDMMSLDNARTDENRDYYLRTWQTHHDDVDPISGGYVTVENIRQAAANLLALADLFEAAS